MEGKGEREGRTRNAERGPIKRNTIGGTGITDNVTAGSRITNHDARAQKKTRGIRNREAIVVCHDGKSQREAKLFLFGFLAGFLAAFFFAIAITPFQWVRERKTELMCALSVGRKDLSMKKRDEKWTTRIFFWSRRSTLCGQCGRIFRSATFWVINGVERSILFRSTRGC